MKNTKQLIINIIAFVLIAVLYVLHFSTNQAPTQLTDAPSKGESSENATADSDEEALTQDDLFVAETRDLSILNIVYVNADSIIQNYSYYKSLRKSMEAKMLRSEKELESEAKKFEADYLDAQKRAATMSQEQLAMTEQLFMQKQQNIMMLRESLAQELSEEEEKLDLLLRRKIQAYFKRLSKEKGYDYVLSYHQGSNVVYGNPVHDITAMVLGDLNREYAATLKK
jgi:outer membrane protein